MTEAEADANFEREGDLLAGMEEDAPDPDRPPRLLVESDRVEGTAVFNRAGEKIGRVKRFLVEKRSGKAQYAEMEFGGFLGLGTDTHPLPWDVLDYDVDKGGYIVDLTREQLHGAPRRSSTEPRAIDAFYEAQIRGYYGLPF